MHYYIDVLMKYATFKGRATRSEFWMFELIDTLITVALYLGGPALGIGTAPVAIYTVATILPNLAVTIRRLHDTGRSGWVVLVGFIPFFGSIALLIMCANESSTDESYGPYPGTAGLLPAA